MLCHVIARSVERSKQSTLLFLPPGLLRFARQDGTTSNLLIVFADLGMGTQHAESIASNMSRIRCSLTGLSTTTTSSGLLDDARTRPQLPSSTVTRTPLTVTRSRIGWPATFSPFFASPRNASPRCRRCRIWPRRRNAATWSATTRFSAGRLSDPPSTCQVRDRASRRSRSPRSGRRHSRGRSAR